MRSDIGHRVLGLGLTVMCGLAAVSTTARAEGGGIALEAYGEARPADADALLAPIYAELAAQGFVHGPELATKIQGGISRSGDVMPPALVVKTTKLVEHGYDAFVQGEFGLAADELADALRTFAAYPATAARDQSLRDITMKAQLGLALAQHRLGNGEQAQSAMAEFLRSFPDREISRKQYGPEPVQLAKRVSDELGQRGKGSLIIRVDDPTCVVFLNDRYLGVGEAKVPDLYPGKYRVYAHRGNITGRVHEIQVTAAREEVVQIRWSLDAALSTTGWTGLAFGSERARNTDESGLAADIASSLSATRVAVLGIRENGDRLSIIGTVLAPDSGKPLRAAALAIEPSRPSRDQIRSLGRYLAGDADLAPPLLAISAKPSTSAGPGIPSPGTVTYVDGPRPYRPWKWVTLVTGVAAAGIGTYLIIVDGDTTCDSNDRCSDNLETAVPGFITLGGGAALVAAGVVLWIADKPSKVERRTSSVGVTPTRAGATLTYSVRF